MAVGQVLSSAESGYTRYSHTNPLFVYQGFTMEGNYRKGNTLNCKASFNFTGTLLRLYCYAYAAFSDSVEVFVDGTSRGLFTTRLGSSLWTIFFEDLSLSDSEHIVDIFNRDPNASSNVLAFNGIDISNKGVLKSNFPPSRTKKSTSDMVLGDRIAIEYTALSNTFGTFANMGKATKPELSLTASATPDGTFYLYHAGYDYLGRMKLVPDRHIQHSISYDSLNSAGVASGSGLPIKIDGKDCVVMLMTGGAVIADKDNEWNKIIAESTLNDSITAGDDSVWNCTTGKYAWLSTATRGGFVNLGIKGGTYGDGNTGTGYVGPELVFRPILLIEPNNAHYLFLKDDYTCHSWDGTALTQVSNDWRQETFEKQTALFLAGTQSAPSATILQPLLKCKVLVYSDDTAMSKPTGSISAVPHKFFVKPKNLISLASFEGVDNASLTSTVSGTGACKILVTIDLVNYKTCNGTSWAIVDTSDLSAIVSNGLTPSTLSAIPKSAWDSLTGGKGGIAFGYLPTIESVSDSAAVDKLTFTVDMKGSWDRAVHGIDYAYGYPQNNILRVTLKTNGDYKINYSEGCVSQ